VDAKGSRCSPARARPWCRCRRSIQGAGAGCRMRKRSGTAGSGTDEEREGALDLGRGHRLALDGGELVTQLGHSLLELAGALVSRLARCLVVRSLRRASSLLMAFRSQCATATSHEVFAWISLYVCRIRCFQNARHTRPCHRMPFNRGQ
jgi:hypothetical protein